MQNSITNDNISKVNINNHKKYNININDYSIEELLNILELSKEDLSRDEIIEQVSFYKSHDHFKNNKGLNNFFDKIENKLLEYVSSNKYLTRNENIISNFNSNIETFDNKNSINGNLINGNTRDGNTTDGNTTDGNTTDGNTTDGNTTDGNTTDEDTIDGYSRDKTRKNILDLIPKNKNIIENEILYQYLHFNTKLRSNSIDTPKTQSSFNITITNVIQIKLSSINIKKPFLISDVKENNKFVIKKYIKKTTNDVVEEICDFSNTITIDDGYYEESSELESYVNSYFTNFIDSSLNPIDISFMNSINFSINNNTKKIKFQLSDNFVNTYSSDLSFYYFIIDFKSNYLSNYSLASILGFNYNKTENYYTSKQTSTITATATTTNINNKITSPHTFSNIGNSELFFCLIENHSNTTTPHKLFLNNNSTPKNILAKINASKGKSSTNFYINEKFPSNNDRNDSIIKYTGPIELNKISIEIIDSYGELINNTTDDNLGINENFTFTLEAKTIQEKLTEIDSFTNSG